MRASNFNLAEYLERIGFKGQVRGGLETLKGIIRAQLQHVPFENTEVQAGRIPSLVPEDIVKKIIHQRRGGYCYEVNGLLSMALSTLGYDWYFAGARPMIYPNRRPKTHMVVIVRQDDSEYLCDAGFGAHGLREPVLIGPSVEVDQDGDRFRLELKDGEYLLSALVNGEWVRQYSFPLAPQEWIEFSLANYFNATHPDTIFTQKKLAIMQTPRGRLVLVDSLFKRIEAGIVTEQQVDYQTALKTFFYR